MPVRLQPAAPRSRVKHSTNEPPRSLFTFVKIMYFGGKMNEETQWNNREFNSFMLSILLRRETMVNVLKFGKHFSFCSQIKYC